MYGPRPSLFLDPQIEKLLQQAADKEKELLALLELTPIRIWNTDLDRFLEEWEVGPRLTDHWAPQNSLEHMLTTESVPRVGGQVRCRLERQESQTETSNAQDPKIHRFWSWQTHWR
jgi:hypothetical protein